MQLCETYEIYMYMYSYIFIGMCVFVYEYVCECCNLMSGISAILMAILKIYDEEDYNNLPRNCMLLKK